MTIGVDVGGTFTDVVRWDGTRLTTAKLADNDQSERGGGGRGPPGRRVEAADPLLLHGTTVATNALLERRGARTRPGDQSWFRGSHRDRPPGSPVALRPDGRPPRASGRRGRIDTDGRREPISPLSLVPHRSRSPSRSSTPISDPGPEADLAARIRGLFPAVPVSVSHRVTGEFREYERISTTVLNAYLRPGGFDLPRRSAEVALAGTGGPDPRDEIERRALLDRVRLRARRVDRALGPGRRRGGGRSVRIRPWLVEGDLLRHGRDQHRCVPDRRWAARSRSGAVDRRYPCRLPSVAVHTIGAGGGSIGWSDPGGALRVGPHSAGADPGPACYGRGGTRPTVTDANLVAGRLGSESSPGREESFSIAPPRWQPSKLIGKRA